MTKINIFCSKNNTIMNVCKKQKVIFWCSSGKINFKGCKKSSPYASQKVAKKICKFLIKNKFLEIDINIKGIGTGKEPSLITFSSETKLNILSIVDSTPIRHNGCRPKKIRRV
ncbi:small ribosomal subunit protein uS11 [Candidatus Vidania fulgoroideorum]